MKKLVSILLLSSCWVSKPHQKYYSFETIYIDTSTKTWRDSVPYVNPCSVGYSWMPSIGTSSLMIEADTCLPDSTCKKLWLDFSKNMCGESGLYMLSFDGTSYARLPEWVNDSIGCVTKEEWRIKRKVVTREQYEKRFPVKRDTVYF